MGDIFLHLAFARRLRTEVAMHPLVGETLTRRPSLVALGATLPMLPASERKGMSFFRRLFSGGSQSARWEKLLAPTGVPRLEIVRPFLVGSGDRGLGPMARLALGIGLLSHEVLASKLGAAAGNADRASWERAQLRLWLKRLPGSPSLEGEWRPVVELADGDGARRVEEHLDAALGQVASPRPGRDAVGRWMRALRAELQPALQNGLPDAIGSDDAARSSVAAFDEACAAARSQIVAIANALAEQMLAAGAPGLAHSAGDLSTSGVDAAWSAASSRAGDPAQAWQAWQRDLRERMLLRGRNDQPAFIDGVGEVKAVHRSNAFTGMMSLADLPPEALPSDLRTGAVGLPTVDGIGAPPIPAQSGEYTVPPLPPPSIPPAPAAEDAAAFQAPALTQEVSLADIQAAEAAMDAVSSTGSVPAASTSATAGPADAASTGAAAIVVPPVSAEDVVSAAAPPAAAPTPPAEPPRE